MDQQQRQLVKKYIDIALRRKKIILAFLLVGLVGGLGVYLKTPKVYQCTSLIQYQRQKINPTAMSPDDIRSQTREVVANVSQQITSRTSLEAMINEFNLYPESRAVLPMEDVVDAMRESHIKISNERGDIFKVSYQGSDPKKVLRVTNALAAKFIEENLRYREERASETSAYVQDELKMAKAALDKKEEVMRDYKLQYYNEMPGQMQSNMTRLNALQEQYQNNQDSIHDLERTKLMVQEQISLREELLNQQLQSGNLGVNPSLTGNKPVGIRAEINQLRRDLQDLQLRYTDKHPEVKRLRKKIEELEQTHQAELAESEGTEETETEDSTASGKIVDLQIEQLKHQLKDLEYNIVQLKDERLEIQKQIEKYKKWVEAAPVREAEWAALTRDYEQLHQHYETLVAQSLQAESAHTLEKHQKGSQFKIIDPAHLPETPFKPDFRKIMLLAAGLSLGIGAGLAYGIELLDTSFKDPGELETYLGVPVVCAIPNVSTKKELARQRLKNIAWCVLFCLSYGGLAVGALYLWRQGMIVI